MQLRHLLITLVLFAGVMSNLSAAQPSPSPVRREANELQLMLNIAVRMAVFAANGELFVPMGSISPAERKVEAQEILNYLTGKNSPDFVATTRPLLPIPRQWDGMGVIEHHDRLNVELENAIAKGEINQPNARLLRASVLEIGQLIRRAIGLAKDSLLQENERSLKEKLVDLKILLIAARGSYKDPLLEGGARSVMENLPPDR